MHGSARRFARALAERIGEVLPEPLTVHVDGSYVDVYAKDACLGGSGSAIILEPEEGEVNDERTPAERVETAARAVLSAIQDVVSEYLTLPWPTDAVGEMAMPDARADADRVHLWFGTRQHAAVVALRPIQMREITG